MESDLEEEIPELLCRITIIYWITRMMKPLKLSLIMKFRALVLFLMDTAMCRIRDAAPIQTSIVSSSSAQSPKRKNAFLKTMMIGLRGSKKTRMGNGSSSTSKSWILRLRRDDWNGANMYAFNKLRKLKFFAHHDHKIFFFKL